MREVRLSVCVVCFLACSAASWGGESPSDASPDGDAAGLLTPVQKRSYSVGYDNGKKAAMMFALDMDKAFLARGFEDGRRGGEFLMDEPAMSATLMAVAGKLGMSREQSGLSRAAPALGPLEGREEAPEGDNGLVAARPQTEREKLGYVFGVSSGVALQSFALPLDDDWLIKGFRDALEGTDPVVSEREMQQELGGLDAAVEERREARVASLAQKNRVEGDAFLAANAQRGGVVTLKSGLQYEVIKEGSGPMPRAGDAAVLHYRGTLLDGHEFANTRRFGKPTVIPVGAGIAGWAEALPLMRVGATWRLFVPPELGYGEKGYGTAGDREAIEPNATLIFEMELLAVK
ncbi:MAG: FKBP-type peptidyl-prolyl cis-trans isomerase [Armatimonadetes bacterium]|nr:FKBP-type peptidyl-prolyl cis-trans isomerase [Armatimonadota bacterium]